MITSLLLQFQQQKITRTSDFFRLCPLFCDMCLDISILLLDLRHRGTGDAPVLPELFQDAKAVTQINIKAKCAYGSIEMVRYDPRIGMNRRGIEDT